MNGDYNAPHPSRPQALFLQCNGTTLFGCFALPKRPNLSTWWNRRATADGCLVASAMSQARNNLLGQTANPPLRLQATRLVETGEDRGSLPAAARKLRKPIRDCPLSQTQMAPVM